MSEAPAIVGAAHRLCSRFVTAWNAHDMGAFAELFHPDATFVNRYGMYWRGRDAVVAAHAEIHRTIYRDMWLEPIRIDADAVTDEVAVVHFLTRARVGEAMPAGPRLFDSDMMLVVVRDGEEALIRAGENVAVLDPRTGDPILTPGAGGQTLR